MQCLFFVAAHLISAITARWPPIVTVGMEVFFKTGIQVLGLSPPIQYCSHVLSRLDIKLRNHFLYFYTIIS